MKAATKTETVATLVKLLTNDRQEAARLTRYHMGRPVAAVRETLQRTRAIKATSDAFCRRHCQFGGLPRLGR